MDDSRVSAKLGQQPLERACAGLEPVDPPRGAELRERDAGERLRRVREDTDLRARSLELPEQGADRRRRTEIDGRPVLREPPERIAPVPDSVGGPAVELGRGLRPVARKRGGVELGDRSEAAGGPGGPVLPQRPGGAGGREGGGGALWPTPAPR